MQRRGCHAVNLVVSDFKSRVECVKKNRSTTDFEEKTTAGTLLRRCTQDANKKAAQALAPEPPRTD